MKLIYPNESEIMLFFQKHADFKTVFRISELLISKYHNNIQEEEWRHIWAILHDLKRDDFLIVKNEGKNIHEEEFTSTPDRTRRYFEKHRLHDLDNLQTKTDDELKDIMRHRIANKNMAHSVYHKARQELEFRSQSSVVNNGIIANGSVSAGGDVVVGDASRKEKGVSVKKFEIISLIAAILTIVGVLVNFFV